MKATALLFHVSGVAHCIIDTRAPSSLDGLLEFMQRSFPENGARICTVEVTEVSDATAPTLRPSAPVEPEPINLNCKHCGEPSNFHGSAGRFLICRRQRAYEPINPGPREPMATLDESEAG